MADEIKQQKQEAKKNEKAKESKRPEEKILLDVKLVRIMSKDIPGNKKVYVGLTEIKGISWAFSNAVCRLLKLDKNKQIQELTEEEIKKIQSFIENPKIPAFILNRRKDVDTGIDKHLFGTSLDLQREFDIKKQKKIKSYKGIRHSQGQPVRGQRTKSHFRSNRKKSGAVGVRKTSSSAVGVKKPVK
jgi:small subunit ribosomal protein S13